MMKEVVITLGGSRGVAGASNAASLKELHTWHTDRGKDWESATKGLYQRINELAADQMARMLNFMKTVMIEDATRDGHTLAWMNGGGGRFMGVHVPHKLKKSGRFKVESSGGSNGGGGSKYAAMYAQLTEAGESQGVKIHPYAKRKTWWREIHLPGVVHMQNSGGGHHTGEGGAGSSIFSSLTTSRSSRSGRDEYAVRIPNNGMRHYQYFMDTQWSRGTHTMVGRQGMARTVAEHFRDTFRKEFHEVGKKYLRNRRR